MAVKTVYLVRHGHYESWQNKAVDGEGRLTGFGQEQAQAAARRISSLPLTAIHCSTLNRAQQTCQIIAEQFPNLKSKKSALLCEGIPVIPPRWQEFLSDYPEEDLAVDRARADKAFRTFFTKPKKADAHELIVAHGNLIRYLLCRVLEVDVGSWGYMEIDHCSISEVRITSKGWMKLMRMNDTCHLPAHLVTSTRHGGLADTLWQAARQARDNDDLDLARKLGRDALGFYFSLDHEITADIQQWLDDLPA